MRRHLDYFAAHQTQLFVVVEHRVHVFDPHGVNWAVEDQPFPVRALLDTRGTGIHNNPLDVRKKKKDAIISITSYLSDRFILTTADFLLFIFVICFCFMQYKIFEL